MKKILFATGNETKAKRFSKGLQEKGIEVITLKDINTEIEVEENGKDAIENAVLKAKAYSKVVDIPVFAMDDNLYLENVPEENQPGMYVRRVNGKRLNDEEDSYLLKGLLNIYNENYPRDISNKVKTALTTKKINGEFVTSYAPYGYKKSRYEKNKIIIDTEAAKNVKMIFDSIEKGLSKKEIVDILNNKKIKTPMEYIKNSDEGKMWNISMITGILNNKVYVGDLIQQKRKRISFKNHKFVKTKEDELIITKNNHMEIISKEQFERVQDIIKHSAKVNSNNEYDIFSGYLKCAECDSNLTIRKSKEYTYYACSS